MFRYLRLNIYKGGVKLKKYLKLLFLTLVVCFALVGCTTNVAYTFNVETGDNVKVELDTSSGYSLSQSDGTFSVSKDNDVLSQGMFITEDGYNYYYEIVTSSGSISNTESTKLSNMDYTYYETTNESGDTEYNYLIWLNNSKTGIILGSLKGDTAKDIFSHLTFTID